MIQFIIHLCFTCCEDVSHDDLRDLLWPEPSTLQDILDHQGTQVSQRHRGKSTVQRPWEQRKKTMLSIIPYHQDI